MSPTRRSGASFTSRCSASSRTVALAWLVEMQWPTIHSAKLKNVVRNGLGPNDNFAEAYFEE